MLPRLEVLSTVYSLEPADLINGYSPGLPTARIYGMSRLLQFLWRPAERRGYYTNLIIPQLNLTPGQAALNGPALVPGCSAS